MSLSSTVLCGGRCTLILHRPFVYIPYCTPNHLVVLLRNHKTTQLTKMSNASEVFGFVTGVFGMLTAFSFVGGLLPRSQMKEIKGLITDSMDILEEAAEDGSIPPHRGVCRKAQLLV